MKSFYEFDFRNNISDKFEIIQKEIKLKKEALGGKSLFEVLEINYSCVWKEKDFDEEKPTIIIPTKNMSELLAKTVANLKNNDVLSVCNVIIVDDNSDEDIFTIASECCYLRIENDKGFNFSMLNNIACLI
jgi:hypothetical protein